METDVPSQTQASKPEVQSIPQLNVSPQSRAQWLNLGTARAELKRDCLQAGGSQREAEEGAGTPSSFSPSPISEVALPPLEGTRGIRRLEVVCDAEGFPPKHKEEISDPLVGPGQKIKCSPDRGLAQY